MTVDFWKCILSIRCDDAITTLQLHTLLSMHLESITERTVIARVVLHFQLARGVRLNLPNPATLLTVDEIRRLRRSSTPNHAKLTALEHSSPWTYLNDRHTSVTHI